jgi:hypothetical protein
MTDREVPPPDEELIPKWFDDSKAKKEDQNWDKEGKLKGQQETNHLWWLRAYGVLIVLFLVVFAFLFLGSLASWAAHYMLPMSWHWLTLEQLTKIQSVLFSGGIGGVVSLVAQRQLSK